MFYPCCFLRSSNTYLHEAGELLLRVEDHDDEGRAGDVLAAPLDLDAVVPGLGRLVLAEDRAVLLRLALHLHSERAW